MPDVKHFSLIKPTNTTQFHIDFEWWKDNDHDWRVHLEGCLCESHKDYFQQNAGTETIDWVHPETAEIQRVDALQHIIIEHCAKQPEFVTPQTMMVEAVFRTFLANGNAPLTPEDIEEHIGKPATTILRTIAGKKVYMGIRPYKA